MPLVRDEDFWRRIGWRVFRISVISFGILGLLAGLSVARSGGEVSLGLYTATGWQAIWVVALLMAAAGGLFGAVWLLIFKALALASRS
jgi:predicted membrane channel-forming protein YqfA (hemolysin III family)